MKIDNILMRETLSLASLMFALSLRYLDLISRELRKVDHMAEKQTKLRIKEDGIMTTLEENLVSVDKLKR